MKNMIFKFDPNKCTGCNACQIACILENDLDYSSSWRQLVTYNEHRHPDQQVFHLSISCNHCADPPCLKYCPAQAFHQENKYSTVQIDPEKCIGCKYCSWVCPYDAPEFDPIEKTMHKCTFCIDRLGQNMEPACVTICPTDALQSCGSDTRPPDSSLPGFTKADIDPSLEILPLRKDIALAETHAQPFDDETIQLFRSLQKNQQDKISLKSEWTLILFSILVSSLIGYTSAYILNHDTFSPLSFLFLGFSGMLIGSFHLGKKIRAYRAIFNWRRSWLSREILFYTIFLIFATIFNFSDFQYSSLGVITIIIGFLTLVSMDMVYFVLPQIENLKIHSSGVFLTGLLFLGFFIDYNFFAIVLIAKFVLYFARKLKSRKLFSLFSIFRIISGFILAPLIWYLPYDFAQWISFVCLITGEFADRVQFFQELDIVTPYKQMNLDLMQSISGIRNTRSQNPNSK